MNKKVDLVQLVPLYVSERERLRKILKFITKELDYCTYCGQMQRDSLYQDNEPQDHLENCIINDLMKDLHI